MYVVIVFPPLHDVYLVLNPLLTSCLASSGQFWKSTRESEAPDGYSAGTVACVPRTFQVFAVVTIKLSCFLAALIGNQKMVAHSQFCMSGDHTVEATERAMQRAVQEDEEADQNIVVVVSDANFERYGITPQDIGGIMVSGAAAYSSHCRRSWFITSFCDSLPWQRSNHQVSCHLVMLASLEDEAEELRKELPKGAAHICYRTDDLPQAFKTILTEAGGALDTSN